MLNRKIAVFTLFTLILSAWSLSLPSAADAAKVELGSLLSSAYVKIIKSGKYTIRYKAVMVDDGEKTEADLTVATNGKSTSVKTSFEGITMRTLKTATKIYNINDKSKTYMVMNMPMTAASPFNKAEKMEFVGSGTAELDGVKMDYEEYRFSDSKMRFYFKQKKLYAMQVREKGAETVMKILELSDKVDAALLTIPSNYREGIVAPGMGDSEDE